MSELLYQLAICFFWCQFSKEQRLLSGNFFSYGNTICILATFAKTHFDIFTKFFSYFLHFPPLLFHYFPLFLAFSSLLTVSSSVEKVPGVGLITFDFILSRFRCDNGKKLFESLIISVAFGFELTNVSASMNIVSSYLSPRLFS